MKCCWEEGWENCIDPVSSKYDIVSFFYQCCGSASAMKTDPCPYLVKYLNGVIKKKTKVIDIFNSDKKGVYHCLV